MAFTKAQLDAYIQALYDNDGQLSSEDYQLIINYILSNGEPETNPRDLIQIRRGDEADLPELAQGELAVTLDTATLYVGGLNGNIKLKNTDSAINILNPPKHLQPAIDGGVIDTTARMQAILNYAGVNKMSVFIPDGTFLVSNLNTAGCLYIYGNGANSLLLTDSTGSIFTITEDETTIKDLSFKGTYKDQIGVTNVGKFKCQVVGCTFENLGSSTGGGVFVSGVGTSQYGLLDGMKIESCSFYSCVRGIDVGLNGEYVTINDCIFQKQCGWAIWTEAGNTLITGCNIAKCQNGIYVSGTSGGVDSNGGHSVISSTNINHVFNDFATPKTVGFALWFNDLILGEVVDNCAIFDGNIMIVDSKGVAITNSILGVANYYFEGSEGCSIENCYFYRAYGHSITPNYNSKPSHVNWFNNINYDGTHGNLIEEIRGGQVVGTPINQTVANSQTKTIEISAVSNTANYPNQQKHAFWDAATSKAKNLGMGGNRIKVNAKLYADFAGGANPLNTVATINVGLRTYQMAINSFPLGNSAYYAFDGIVDANPNEEIYIDLVNVSGGTATIVAANCHFFAEGL